MSYDSVALGVAATPGVSPRGEQHANESFFYTLVFPAPLTREMPRINYSEVGKMLRGVTAGGPAREARAIDELRSAWEAKFRSGPPMGQDMIPFSTLQELMRDVVIARFSALPGMTIRSRAVSQDDGRVLLSFRPSPALLRATAERLKVRVPISSALEVDSKDSNEGENLWGQTEAQVEFYRLFLEDKIVAEDAQIFDYEDSGMWSRRLRALKRFSNGAMKAEEEMGYLPFRDLSALRYVYRQIDDEGDGGSDIDGSTLSPFRVVDKIRLTKALINAEFDCDALLERGLLEHHICPHTHRTTDVDTCLNVLQVQWGALSSPWRGLSQCFRRSEPATDHLIHVRNYFGEQIALYFAFASFHATALRTLGLLALILALVASTTSRPKEAEAAFCLCSCAFLGIYVRKWELQETRLAARWSGGTPKDGNSAVNPLLQLPRPQFRGKMRRSPVTLRLEPYSTVGQDVARRLASALVLVGLTLELGASNAVLVASNRFQILASETSSRFDVALCVIALITKCATPHLARCSQALTNWENHRLQRDYDSQLTFKFAVLQSANSFGALWGLAFLRPLRCKLGQCRYPEHAEASISSHDQASRMLVILLGLDVTIALWGLRWAVWRFVCSMGSGWRQVLTEMTTRCLRKVGWAQGGSSGPTTTLLKFASTPVGSSIESDLALAPYEGVLFDYAQVLIPLGCVAWFAPLAPLSSCVLAWIVAALQIRADAHSLCYDTQRPFPIQALSLGSWLGYLHVLRIGAVLHSTIFMLMIFVDTSAANLDNKTFEQRVVTLGGLFTFVGWVAYALKGHQDLTDERRLKLLKAKQAALERKYLGHLGTHLAASAKASLPPGRVFLNGVPRYVVTGDKGEEDVADEIRAQWVQLQKQMKELDKRITKLRDNEDGSPTVGVLYVDVQGVSLLPIASPIQSFVQFCVQSGTTGTGSENLKAAEKREGGHASTSLSTQVENTSVSKKSRSPLWHESFKLPVTALRDVLALRLCDGGPMLSTIRQQRVLGRSQLSIEDVISRTSNNTQPILAKLPAVVSETKSDKPILPASSSSSSSDEAGDISSPRPSVPKRRSSGCRSSSRTLKPPMATYELPLELPESIRRTKQSELAKHGPPRLALRCGVRLNTLGSLLVQQRRLREKLALLHSQEIQLSNWGERSSKIDQQG
ncbi:hypothetical protein V7S43_000895 [Phytophthora oleae]|uniref:C2 domain-containing protein n=1 Tax=Phytophthora oleae TaxID=2107226 RepID=A0ABD3G716_9STRA